MKRIIFIQIGTGVFAVEIDQIKSFVVNVKILDYGNKDDITSIMGLLQFYDEVIPVLDSYRWFGQKRMNFSSKTIFVVMAFGGKSFAFQISAVIKSVEVPGECFHAVPAVFKQENAGVFREVIDWGGTLYLKIEAETILKEMSANIEALSSIRQVLMEMNMMLDGDIYIYNACLFKELCCIQTS